MGGRVEGRVVIITGGARGIGEAAVRLFSAEGARVVIADRPDSAGEALAKELGADVAFVGHDVRDEASWGRVVQTATDKFGPPSVLVNNAGVMLVGPIEFATVADFETTYAINTIGAFLGMKAVLPAMRANGGGAIVNMASNAGVVGTYGLPAYAASKAATIALTKTAALEFGADRIRVNAIAPGGVDTPMSNQPEFEGMDKDSWYIGLPVPRIGQPAEIAAVQLFLASEESSYCTGAVFLVDGGQLAGPKAF